MVSQLEQPPPAAPSAPTTVRRGPSSVVSSSRPSHNSKRYTRSHTGAPTRSNPSSSSPFSLQNEFPVFTTTGDIEIVIRARDTPTVQNRYLLHFHTLTRCTSFFDTPASPEYPRSRSRLRLPAGNELSRLGSNGDPVDPDVNGGSSRRKKPHQRCRYELDPNAREDEIPMLVPREDEFSPSFIGPGSTSVSDLGVRPSPPAANSGHHRMGRSRHGHSQSVSSAPGGAGRRFFRSVANLGLSSSSSTSSSNSSAAAAAAAKGQPPAPPLSMADQDLLRDYDNLFRIFYNYSPVLDGVNVADAYVQCKSLLVLADQYGALDVVGPRVDHHMLQFQSRLWRQIAKYPVSYLRLGFLAHSKVIFQEALIHVVGQWPVGERSIRANLPEAVLDLIEDKVDELEEMVGRVEGRLFRMNLSTSRGERVAPSTNYIDWLALSLFRQWVADNTSPQPPAPAPPPTDPRRRSSSRDHRSAPTLPPAMPPLASVGRAYRTLGAANPSSFLAHEECKRFLKLTPELYSRDNLRRVEKRIDELKTMAREIVRPLMSSSLELDMGGSNRGGEGIMHLTCISITSRDLPWDFGGSQSPRWVE